uniref:Mitotic-spindle organizing protein associated with a ring of gamma-tubulin 1 n=1 Tax=Parastrongyloides trichosuri TaxID=131310 RepID=A0A0N4Z8Q2_PARTI
MTEEKSISQHTLDVISDTALNLGLFFTESQIEAIVYAINNGYSAKTIMSILALACAEESNGSSTPFSENR